VSVQVCTTPAPSTCSISAAIVIVPTGVTEVDLEVHSCRPGAAASQRICGMIWCMLSTPAIEVPVRKKGCRLHSAVTIRHLSGISVLTLRILLL